MATRRTILERCWPMWGWVFGLAAGIVLFAGVEIVDAVSMAVFLAAMYPPYLAALDRIREGHGG